MRILFLCPNALMHLKYVTSSPLVAGHSSQLALKLLRKHHPSHHHDTSHPPLHPLRPVGQPSQLLSIPSYFSRTNYPHPLTPSLDLRSGNSASSLCYFSLNYMLLLYKDDVMHMQHLNRAPYHTAHAYYPPHAYSSTTTEGSLSKDSIQDACRFWSPRHPMHIHT